MCGIPACLYRFPYELVLQVGSQRTSIGVDMSTTRLQAVNVFGDTHQYVYYARAQRLHEGMNIVIKAGLQD